MNNYKELKTLEDYQVALEKCKELVIKDIKESHLCDQWDGMPTNVTPEEHFQNIVDWCNENIKSTIWSIHNSSKCGFYTSYGAKHKCERDLKCYVGNNYIKLAMIYAGLEVCNRRMVDNDTEYVYKSQVKWQDILTNSENFICRRNKKDYSSIKWECLCPYVNDDLKYCPGNYERTSV